MTQPNLNEIKSFEEFLASWDLTIVALYGMTTPRGQKHLEKVAALNDSITINFANLFLFSDNTKFNPSSIWFDLNAQWFSVINTQQKFPFYRKNNARSDLVKKFDSKQIDEFNEELL